MGDGNSAPPQRGRNPLRAYTTRKADKQVKLMTQTWPEFFRGLAIEVAVIVGILLVVTVVVLLTRG